MVSIEFCKKCKAILIPIKKGGTTTLKCRKCGTSSSKVVKDVKIVKKLEKKKGIVLLEKDDVALPLTEKICPKCEHTKAYYWLQQTRSADEPPTQFFKCEKCKHVWREYK